MKRVLNLLAGRKGFFFAAILLLGLIVALPARTWAQSGANSGQIVGQVLDPSKAVVAGVEVTVRNKDTNFQRTAMTDNEGRYAATLLPLGPYEVTVKAPGLQAATQEVNVTLGATVTANLDTSVQPVSESMEVTAQQLSVDAARPSPKAVLTDLQIHNLPFVGRRVQNLVVQNPAALIEPECSGFSVSGQKGIYANVSIDGGDYDSVWQCGVRARSGSAPSFGLEALQEIQVVRNSFSSEFGRSTGGVITMSTRSGTNQFHGTAYELVRDGSLAAKDALGRVPVARTHQFGGSFGGPIAKDRTFFFVAPEFQYGSKPLSVVYGMSDAQRASAAGQALLAVAPEETLDAVSNGQSVINRIDHHFSDSNSFFGRFDYTRTIAVDSPGSSPLQTGIGFGTTTSSAESNLVIAPQRNYTTLGQWTSTLSPSHLNELRFQFARETRPRVYQGAGPQVSITSVGTYGPASSASWGNVAFNSTDNRYQLVDNFSIVSGAHTTKIGADYERIAGHADYYNGSVNGAYTFSNLDNFLARSPTSYTQFTGNGSINLVINELGLYVQDEWRILPGVTLSPGLRYEAQWNPDYLPATAPQNRFPPATHIPDDTKMFAPRMGLAWNIGNDGKTVLRAGGGLYYAATYMSLLAQSIMFNGGNPDKAFSVSLSGASTIQNAFQSVGLNLTNAPLGSLPVFDPAKAFQLFGSTTGLAPSYFDPKFRNPRALQWELGLQREIAKGVSASVDYAYINTLWVARERDTNLGAPVVDATGRNIYSNPRPYAPQFGRATITEPAGRSLYRAFTSSLNVRRSRYTVDMYYTRSWNYTYDDVERGFTGLAYADVNNIKSDYSYSNIDEPQQFRGTVNYSLPFGFDIASTMKFTAGRPITARTGGDTNLDGNSTDRPIENGVMFKRNTFRNQGFKDFSLRIQKNFVLPNEKGTLSFTADATNLFNFHNIWMASSQNYGVGTILQNGNLIPDNPQTVAANANFLKVKDGSGNYVSGLSVANDSRTIQLGVRFQF